MIVCIIAEKVTILWYSGGIKYRYRWGLKYENTKLFNSRSLFADSYYA